MKFNVFLKTLTAFFIIFLVFIFAFFKYMKSVEIAIAVNSEKVISEGFLLSLEKELTNKPAVDWDTILNKKNNGVYLLPISKIELNQKQKQKLATGSVVVLTSLDHQFLNLVIDEKTAYKQVGDTKYALAYNYSSMEKITSHYMKPALNQIVSSLQLKPQSAWREATKELEKTYGYPINVYQPNSTQLPSKITKSLLRHDFVFETNKGTTQIGVFYYAFNGGVLKVGPFSYLSITSRISDVIGYFILAFFIFSFFLIVFL